MSAAARLSLSAIALVGFLTTATLAKTDTLLGPILATVLSVGDGDTIHVRARVWLEMDVTTPVRLRGVDTPELKGKCQAERDAAVRARDFLKQLLGDQIVLVNIAREKYGRPLADLRTTDGRDVAAELISAGHARAYHGERRTGWC